MKRIVGLLRYLLTNFGPLITFYGIDHFFGLRPALVCSLGVTIFEVWNLKVRKKEQLSGFFKLSSILALLFGILDLYLAKTVFLRYEAALMSLIFGGYFALTLFGEQPIMIEFARRSGKLDRELTPPLVSFFRYLTALWVAYFFAKSGFYFWRAQQSDSTLGQLLLARLIAGNGSLAAMIVLTTYGSRPLYRLLSKAGLLDITGKGLDTCKPYPSAHSAR